jgi:FMN-dependent NADH-azoreductase
MNPAPSKLLRIDASSRVEGSHSRRLADAVQAEWKKRHPGGQVVRRDLSRLPHIQAQTIAGYYTPPDQMTPELKQATALSDELIGELKSATTVLIASPLYNFSVPSALKAWIDQVVRIGHTFSYDGSCFGGLVTGPNAILALAYGAGGYQGPMAAMDHLKPYLSALLGFLGVQDVRTVAIEATTADAASVEAATQTALASVPALFAKA